MARSSSKSKKPLTKQPTKQPPASQQTSSEPTENESDESTISETTELTPEQQEILTLSSPEPDETAPESGSPSETDDSEQGQGDDEPEDPAQDDEKAPENDEQPEQVSQDPEPAPEPAESPRDVHGNVPDGLIIPIGEPVRVEADVIGNTAVISRDVYQEKYLMGSRRKTYTLLYKKGATIPRKNLELLQPADGSGD